MKRRSRNHLTKLLIPAIHTSLTKLQRDLKEVQEMELGRPARLYLAYRDYTIYFNIMVLQNLLMSCGSYEREAIKKTLFLYHKFKESLQKGK